MSEARRPGRAPLPLHVLLLAGAPLSAGCAPSPIDLLDAVVPESGYELSADIAYGPDPRQRVDVYRPLEPAPRSRDVVFVYGGAWRQGHKEDYRFVAQSLADAGHTVIVPDYRLYPDVVWPAFAEDVVAAITTLANGGTAFDGTLDEIVLMGHSSGAHTAALLASDPRFLDGSGTTPVALVAISGPYDLPLDNPEVRSVFAGVTAADSLSPPGLVTAGHPPTLLMHGEDDERVLPKHTERYAAALESAGVPLTLHWLDGAGHVMAVAGLATPLDFLGDGLETVLAFLDTFRE